MFCTCNLPEINQSIELRFLFLSTIVYYSSADNTL